MAFSAPREELLSLIQWRIDNLYRPFGYERLNLSSSPPSQKQNRVVPRLDGLEVTHEGAESAEAEGGGGAMELADFVSSTPSADIQCLQLTSLDTVINDLSPMLLLLGHHLSTSPQLLSRICQLLARRGAEMTLPTNTTSGSSSVVNEETALLIRIVSEVLLPSLTRIDCNPAIASLCWSVISLFPFQIRFDMYSAWRGGGLGKSVSPFDAYTRVH
jgi:hypothetical protein